MKMESPNLSMANDSLFLLLISERRNLTGSGLYVTRIQNKKAPNKLPEESKQKTPATPQRWNNNNTDSLLCS